jgi:nucleoid-associated protein YgaU
VLTTGTCLGEVIDDAAFRAGRISRMRLLVTAVCLSSLAGILMQASGARANPVGTLRPIVTRVRLRDAPQLRRALHVASHRAHAAIVGGSRISISQAPWQVLVVALISRSEAILCGGSILNDQEVLTAGHCVYNPGTRSRIPTDQIVVLAGSSDVEVTEPEEQFSVANEVRVHPYYVYNPEARSPAPDDVAVVSLKTPLALDTFVQPIDLTAETLLAPGTAVNLTGFGEERPLAEFSGELHSIAMSLLSSRECGGEDDALFLCASTPVGSACLGDSGGALTLPGSGATEVGVTDTIQVIEGKLCLPGSGSGYANLAAPEIRDFVLDDDSSPPRAPRGGEAALRGMPDVGSTLTCESGFWSNSPAIEYVFINSAGQQVLQRGLAATYALSGADVGRTILCEVLASNAGGIGTQRTQALAPVRRTQQEEEAAAKAPAEEAAAKQQAEEVAAKHQAEAVAKAAAEANAAATKKRQEEEAANAGVLGSREGSPDAVLVDSSLRVGVKGTVRVKIACPAGVDGCSGTVTLHTLSALAAGAGDARTARKMIVTLASGSFVAAGGQTKTVTLRLTAKARQLLSRVRLLRVRVTIVAHDSAGAGHTTQAVATLRAVEQQLVG